MREADQGNPILEIGKHRISIRIKKNLKGFGLLPKTASLRGTIIL